MLSALTPSVWAQTPDETRDAREAEEIVDLPPLKVLAPRDELSTIQLDRPAPTASRTGVTPRELPFSMTSITAEHIQKFGYVSGSQALANAPGMTGGDRYGGLPDFSLRGFTTDDLAVFHDGINLPIAQNLIQANHDAYHFDRIDVLRGPASVMYGQGAIGGAINYVSKAPTPYFTADTFVTIGSWRKLDIGAGVGGPLQEGLYGRLDVSRREGGRFTERSDRDWNTVSGSLLWETTPNFTNLLQLKHANIREINPYQGTPAIDGNPIPGLRRRNFNDADTFIDTRDSKAQLTSTVDATDELQFRNTAWVIRHDFEYQTIEAMYHIPGSDPLEIFRDRLNIFRDHVYMGTRPEAVWTTEPGEMRNILTVGGEYGRFIKRNNAAYSNDPADGLGPTDPFTFQPQRGFTDLGRDPQTDSVITNYALFAEDFFQPREPLKLIGGLRHDWYEVNRKADFADSSNTGFSYRGGVVYDVVENASVYASYAEAVRPAVALSAAIDASEAATLNADDENQRGRQVEIGTKTSFLENRAHLTVALFNIEKTNVLGSAGSGAQRQWYLIGEQVSRGIETIFEVNPSPGLLLGLDATFQRVRFEDFRLRNLAGDVTQDFSGNRPPNVPQVILGANASQTFEVPRGMDLTFGGNVRYVGDRPDNRQNTIFQDSYVVGNVFATLAGESWSLTARVFNVTNEEYATWSALGAPEGLRDRQLLLADPRSFELTLRCTF